MSESSARRSVRDPLIGRVIENRYVVQRKLGEGGIGSVYIADDRKMMNRSVVVKVLLDDWLADPEIRRKFDHEKEALARLQHPSIVNILDAGVLEDGIPYIVMPLIAGRTLKLMMEQSGSPSWLECADIIESVTDALAAAHSAGVLHRDVKPANIMIADSKSGKRQVLLIDFGIARVFDSQISPVTDVNRTLGTVMYIAPEQLAGNPNQGAAVDIYACGVVAYEMLTGELPFAPESFYEMLLLQEAGLQRPPSAIRNEIPYTIDAIIAKALEYRPEDRYQSIEEFGDELSIELRRFDLSLNMRGPESEITRAHAKRIYFANQTERIDPAQIRAASIDSEMHHTPTLPFTRSIRVEVQELSPPVAAAPAADSKSAPAPRIGYLVPLAAGVAAAFLLAIGIAAWALYPKLIAPDDRPALGAEKHETQPAATLQYHLSAEPPAAEQAGSGTNYSDGSETFSSGSKLTFHFTPGSDGYLYLFSESSGDSVAAGTVGAKGMLSAPGIAERLKRSGQLPPVAQSAGGITNAGPVMFYLLFPTESQNGGVPTVKAGQDIKTGSLEFEGPPGTEKIWVVWTKQLVKEIDDARTDALLDGEVNDAETIRRLKDFLETNADKQVRVEKGTDSFRTTLRGGSEMIVRLVEIKHR